jgi:hypothetical protein
MTEREAYDPADYSEPSAPPLPESVPPEVPEADAIEQAAPLTDERTDEPETIGDAPEADAIEQHTEVEEPDDYRG